ncbi:MAG: hypothetical protein M3356_06440 [Actinomycetota bacterium]|nr:hypothetical protein [Actinomycetota bacterium]
MDPAAVRNRLVMATAMWREATDEPLPRMPPGDPIAQLEAFEIQVVELLFAEATPETARLAANKTWDLVHDRPDADPVKLRVVSGHEDLARRVAEAGGEREPQPDG